MIDPPHTPVLQALILPEVLFHIGCYLNAREALICSQVCSAWYINFAPLIWANVHIGQPKPYAIDCKYKYRRELDPRIRSIDLVSEGCNLSEQLDILRNKASWLRSLTIHQHLSPQQFALGKECTQLQAVSITGPIPFNNDYTREYWSSCKALLKQNRSSLKSLWLESTTELHFSGKPVLGVPRWDPILSCVEHTNLTELKLVLCSIRGRHLRAFWKICERLERLTLDKVVFDYSRLPTQEQIRNNSKEARAARARAARSSKQSPPAAPPPKRLPHLRKLTINEVWTKRPERILELIIADCPRLEYLDWSTESFSVPLMELFSNLIVAGTWPLLEKLNLSLRCYQHFLVEILQHTRKPLKVMNIYHRGYMLYLGEDTFRILKERHFQALQEVDFTFVCSELVQGSMLQDVLASCPSLEIVRALLLDAAAVKEDKRPWLCLGLKEFIMSIDITTGLPEASRESVQEQRLEQSRAVYAQLARLKQLQYLSLQPTQTRRQTINKECLCLRLKMGLDLLATLTRLEVIHLFGNQDMDRNDVRWMVEHWESLRVVSGGLLNGNKVDKRAFRDKYLWDYELSKILNHQGVETPWSIYGDGYLNEIRHLLGKGWPETDDFVDVKEEPEIEEEEEEVDRMAQEVQAVGE
ncbi:hypothetical protein EC968_007822 [Mortierella alpina]|nr:hypothetical protein EC968_007822 [Mortierella alpina]